VGVRYQDFSLPETRYFRWDDFRGAPRSENTGELSLRGVPGDFRSSIGLASSLLLLPCTWLYSVITNLSTRFHKNATQIHMYFSYNFKAGNDFPSNLVYGVSDKCLTVWFKIIHFTSYMCAQYLAKLLVLKLWQNTVILLLLAFSKKNLKD